MANKLVRVQNGNSCYLTFAVNSKIELIDGDYSYGGMSLRSEREKYGPAHTAVMLHGALMQIGLVTEVSIRPYEIAVQFADAFENDETERTRIRDEATAVIDRIVFGSDSQTIITDKDDRRKYATDFHDAA